jgi:hypothetical protein
MSLPTSDYYKSAMAKLLLYIDAETDDAKCEKAQAAHDDYAHKIIDAAFDRIESRTPKLELLLADLRGVIQRAGNAPSVAGVVGDLNGLVTEVAGVVKAAGGIV